MCRSHHWGNQPKIVRQHITDQTSGRRQDDMDIAIETINSGRIVVPADLSTGKCVPLHTFEYLNQLGEGSTYHLVAS